MARAASGDELLVRYNVRGGGPAWHSRLLIAEAAPAVWAVITPDGDIYVEDYSAHQNDVLGIRERPADRGLPLGIEEGMVYDFRLLPSAPQWAGIAQVGYTEAMREATRRGLPAPPRIDGLVPRWLQPVPEAVPPGGAVAAPPVGAPAAAAPGHAVAVGGAFHGGGGPPPLPMPPPGAFGGAARRLGAVIDAGLPRLARPGAPVAAPLGVGGGVAGFAAAAGLGAPAPAHAAPVAAPVAPMAAAAAAGPNPGVGAPPGPAAVGGFQPGGPPGDNVEDARTLAVAYDATGRRFREYRSAVGLMTEDDWGTDYPISGPRTLGWVLRFMQDQSGTPLGWHSKWKGDGRLSNTDANVLQHEQWCRLLQLGATYDQLCLTNCAAFEHAARQVQLIEEQHKEKFINSGTEAVEEQALFAGQPQRANLCICPLLSSWVGEEIKKEHLVLKERRKAREERALAKKK